MTTTTNRFNAKLAAIALLTLTVIVDKSATQASISKWTPYRQSAPRSVSATILRFKQLARSSSLPPQPLSISGAGYEIAEPLHESAAAAAAAATKTKTAPPATAGNANAEDNAVVPPAGPVDDLPFSDDLRAEDHSDSQQVTSDLHPVYVKPPPEFMPVIYPNSRADGVRAGSAFSAQVALAPPPPPYPYPHPPGVSSWVLGGSRGVQRGGFWERLSSDLALNNPLPSRQQNMIFYVNHSTRPTTGFTSWMFGRPKTGGQWEDMPVLFAHSAPAIKSRPRAPQPAPPKTATGTIRTRLPVGVSSWLLGGVRDLSARHWGLPSALVEQLEFVPLAANNRDIDSPSMTSLDDNYNNYDNDDYNYELIKPVQFDDESDFYNTIRDDH